MKKPNFLIVGAAKSGTTSLFHYLKQHPEVFMPDFKEPQFLVYEKIKGRLHKYIDSALEYYELFEKSTEKCAGEASVFYLYYFEEAIKNIKKELGSDVKIIIVLREPVSRAISAYEHVLRNNPKEKLSFKEALLQEGKRLELEPDLTPMTLYKSMSMYSDAVAAYQNAFANVHVVIYDEFLANTEKSVHSIFNFLDISIPCNLDFSNKYNAGGWQWENEKLKQFALQEGVLKSIIRSLTPRSFRKKAYELFKSKASHHQKIEIDASLKKELQLCFLEDIKKLEKLLNRNLKNWYEVA